jgi:outer membrane protein assembly factor BamE (lipoprotein component of BamABCDE complex)
VKLHPLLIGPLPILLSACSSLGEEFPLEPANRVRNGMTRAEVVAIMGSQPSPVEGGDHGRLTWVHASADPLDYDFQRVSFQFDEQGRVYGIPKPGRIGSFRPQSDGPGD